MANWFVGLSVPAGDWLAALTHDAPSDVRRFHPDDLHMTVAFLGPVDEATARRAWALHGRHGRFEIELGRLAPLGNPRRPSALSALLVRGADEAERIMGTLRDDMLNVAGRPPERRQPLAHVTVARPARKAPPPTRKRAVAWAEQKPAIGAVMTIEQLALYTWSSDRRTRLFRMVETTTLA